jgi:uroporphyrinogen decarboxylase
MPRRPETLSPRERVRLALDHQSTDRIPIAMICSGFEGSLHEKLAAHLGLAPDLYLEQFVDVAVVNDGYRGPSAQYRGPALGRAADGSYEDIWGVWRRPVSYGEGVYYEIAHYPLADVKDIADLDAHRWPEPDWWDYTALPDLIAQKTARRDYALCFLSGNPFERTWWRRGYEQTLMDMVEQPELYHAIMTRVTDFYIAQARRTLEAAGQPIELAFTGDDIAWQQGLMLSVGMIEEHITPHHARLNRALHEFGTKAMFHSDGAVMEAIPALLRAGIDVLQALQFDAAGMDPAAMKARYGEQLCFEGGVSVQRTLPFGTVAEVQAEVRHPIRHPAGERGGDVRDGGGDGGAVGPASRYSALSARRSPL